MTVPFQRTWGWDYTWAAVAKTTGVPLASAAESNVSGSGGGFSAIEPTPSYQQIVPGTHNYHAVQYLTPADYETVPNTEPGRADREELQTDSAA